MMNDLNSAFIFLDYVYTKLHAVSGTDILFVFENRVNSDTMVRSDFFREKLSPAIAEESFL